MTAQTPNLCRTTKSPSGSRNLPRGIQLSHYVSQALCAAARQGWICARRDFLVDLMLVCAQREIGVPVRRAVFQYVSPAQERSSLLSRGIVEWSQQERLDVELELKLERSAEIWPILAGARSSRYS